VTPTRILSLALAAAACLALFLLPQYLMANTSSPSSVQTAQASTSEPNRAGIETIVREYLLENPEILREMADRLKTKDEARAETERSKVFKSAASEVYNSDDQVVLGDPKGDVTIVEFFDYNCGYCKHALADTEELLKSDKKVRLVLKEFPVLSQESVDAARVAVVVAKQAPDKYLDFHRKLLNADGADGATAIGIARDLGLDAERLSADLADPGIETTLQNVQKLARSLGINGTPTYVIGDRVIPGAVGADTLKELVANVRQCGKVEC